ncbi:MADS-box transcription factor PHERES 1 [Linum grandiflorum]
MARPRRPLRWIADDLVRNTYFQKRRVRLIKKVKELSTLCGVQGMCVIYNPYEEPSSFQPWPPPEPPTVWPSCESVVQLMQRFMALPCVERSKKMFNQHEYLREVIMKAEEKQSRGLKTIHDMDLAIMMDEFLGVTLGVEAHDSSLYGLNHIIGETANDPIHIENIGSSSWLDGSDNSDDEYEGVDLELKL